MCSLDSESKESEKCQCLQGQISFFIQHVWYIRHVIFYSLWILTIWHNLVLVQLPNTQTRNWIPDFPEDVSVSTSQETVSNSKAFEAIPFFPAAAAKPPTPRDELDLRPRPPALRFAAGSVHISLEPKHTTTSNTKLAEQFGRTIQLTPRNSDLIRAESEFRSCDRYNWCDPSTAPVSSACAFHHSLQWMAWLQWMT